MELATDLRLIPRRNVQAQTIGDGSAVLIDLGSGSVFELNRVGAEVWNLLGPGATLETICLALRQRYPDGAPTLEADVRELLGVLREAGLVQFVARTAATSCP